jgi:hypothetical protein
MVVDLNAVRKALAKATSGNWQVDNILSSNGEVLLATRIISYLDNTSFIIADDICGDDDAQFIAFARNIIPAMADELEALRAEKTAQDAVVARLQKALADYRETF